VACCKLNSSGDRITPAIASGLPILNRKNLGLWGNAKNAVLAVGSVSSDETGHGRPVAILVALAIAAAAWGDVGSGQEISAKIWMLIDARVDDSNSHTAALCNPMSLRNL
jgi:hypothetical protein